ncbi:MAG TPA: hypothetical protein VFL27_05525 [Candidatus Dormibacteraeota bacterium]|nr:hypothetical protein [Candidatus Dormibacteraeota bacterium]
MLKPAAAVAALLALSACTGATPSTGASSSARTAGIPHGLLAYASDQGVGVLDPSTGKSTIVAPMPQGAFRVAGPVWAPAPGLRYPVLYFTVHDDRQPESRNTAGVVPYDWIFRVDPFAGAIEPVAASQDSFSEGPFGLVANDHYVGVTVGCCSNYEVDALDLTQASAPLKKLAPSQAMYFTEGIAPGSSGLIAAREAATGTWYWLNADAGVLNPFPLALGPDDGPVAISPDGTLAAVALPDHGALIEPINSALPLASPAPTATPSASPSAHPSPTLAAPKRVNSKLPHPDGLSWSPDGKQLALAVGGELEIYSASAADGPPSSHYLAGTNVVGVSWSGPIADRAEATVKASPGPQPAVDALLKSTALPTAADTPQNRPLTRIYVWQFDSAKASPIDSIADATPAVLARYPPLNASVVFHHWAATDTWALLGGCYRYRVVITGSVPAVASTFGLASNTLCSAKPSPSPTASPSH